MQSRPCLIPDVTCCLVHGYIRSNGRQVSCNAKKWHNQLVLGLSGFSNLWALIFKLNYRRWKHILWLSVVDRKIFPSARIVKSNGDHWDTYGQILMILMGAQWLSGKVLDSRSRRVVGSIKPHWRHCVVSLGKTY